MSIVLGNVELRVLGVLIEKSLTQPGGYPLTMNAITLGANQSQNRDPVESLAESKVTESLRGLQLAHLVGQAPPEAGARVVRFVHRVVDVFHWDRREQAVMAELILRGRQTCGELRTRASRMTPLQDVQSVRAILQGLIEADPPFVEELPREAGRSANRFGHLLSVEPPAATRRPDGPAPTQAPPETAPESPAEGADRSLTERISQIEGQVAALTRAVAELRKDQAIPGDASTGSPV